MRGANLHCPLDLGLIDVNGDHGAGSRVHGALDGPRTNATATHDSNHVARFHPTAIG